MVATTGENIRQSYSYHDARRASVWWKYVGDFNIR